MNSAAWRSFAGRKGGFHGIGNARFKKQYQSSTLTVHPGSQGERRELKLELILLADVGLLGMPNAGNQALIRKVSSARPKVADFPFTTLYESGVVRVSTKSEASS